MATVSCGIFPVIQISRDAETPLHQQVYLGFRDAILRGEMAPGQQVPSSRALAAELEISRFPVLDAYSQLHVEGYFQTRKGAGTFVSPSLVPPRGNGASSASKVEGTRQASRCSARYPRFKDDPWRDGWGAFTVHQPALDRFPFETWSKLVARHSRTPRAHAIRLIDPLGLMPLREAICSYLRTARSVHCDPEQIMIVSGSQQALDITTRVLLDARDSAWIEEPCYPLVRSVLVGSRVPYCARSRGRGGPRCRCRSQARAQCPGRFRHPVAPISAWRYDEHFEAAATARLGSKDFRLDCRGRLR